MLVLCRITVVLGFILLILSACNFVFAGTSRRLCRLNICRMNGWFLVVLTVSDWVTDLVGNHSSSWCGAFTFTMIVPYTMFWTHVYVMLLALSVIHAHILFNNGRSSRPTNGPACFRCCHGTSSSAEPWRFSWLNYWLLWSSLSFLFHL